MNRCRVRDGVGDIGHCGCIYASFSVSLGGEGTAVSVRRQCSVTAALTSADVYSNTPSKRASRRDADHTAYASWTSQTAVKRHNERTPHTQRCKCVAGDVPGDQRDLCHCRAIDHPHC